MSWDFGGDDAPPQAGGGWREDPSPAPGAGPTTEKARPGPLAAAESAPAYLLAIGLAFAAIAVGVSLASDSATIACFAWLLGGPLAIGSVAVFLQIDTRRRSHPWYADSTFIPWLRRGLVLLAIVAVAVNAWTIADAIARKNWS